MVVVWICLVWRSVDEAGTNFAVLLHNHHPLAAYPDLHIPDCPPGSVIVHAYAPDDRTKVGLYATNRDHYQH